MRGGSIPCLQALEQTRLAGESVELPGEVLRVEPVERQAVDTVAHGLGETAQPRDQRAEAARRGTRRPRAVRSPTTSTGAQRRRRLRQQAGDLARGERSRKLDDAAPVQRAQFLREPLRHLAVDPDADSVARQLCGFDQQLWSLVRVGRAEEGDGEFARRDARAVVRIRPVPRSLARAASPAARRRPIRRDTPTPAACAGLTQRSASTARMPRVDAAADLGQAAAVSRRRHCSRRTSRSAPRHRVRRTSARRRSTGRSRGHTSQ